MATRVYILAPSLENIVPPPLLRQRATYLCSHLSQVLCCRFGPQPSGQCLVSRKHSGLLWCQEEGLRVRGVTLGLGSWVQSSHIVLEKSLILKRVPHAVQSEWVLAANLLGLG